MELIETPLKDCYIVRNQIFGDDRGFFLESYNSTKLAELGIEFEVKQINFAKSQKNVLRGLHFQKAPFEQAKLVGVISGAVTDVVVDIRKDSPTYFGTFKMKLDSPDTLLYIPKGFAHGYHTLADDTLFYYAVDQFYAPDHESGIRYNDETLNIDWGGIENAVISPKDLNQPLLKELEIDKS